MALALPAIAFDPHSDCNLLREFVEKRHPGYAVVFVNEDEKLLTPAKDSGITVVGKVFYVKGLKMYLIRKSA